MVSSRQVLERFIVLGLLSATEPAASGVQPTSGPCMEYVWTLQERKEDTPGRALDHDLAT